MYRSSRFGVLTKALPRAQFDRLVQRHQSDKFCKGYDSWSHLVAMIYAQLTGVRSLRELETGFNAQVEHHYHLGVRPMKRSTMSDANAKRDCELFADLCSEMLKGAHRQVRQELKKKLYLLDSSPIPLKGLGYEWAEEKHNHRVQGLSVHMVIAPNSQTPTQATITYANETDLAVAREMIEPESGATYVFDRGYCDYNWWFKLHQSGAQFVTRLKKNARVEVVKNRSIKEKDRGYILEDSVICFRHERNGGGRGKNPYYGKTLRKIVVARPDHDSPLVLVSNDRKRHARQLAALYKQRWEIELFFKWMKQNLKIKQFLGRTENAVKIQIYCAIIAYLLAAQYRKNHTPHMTLKEIMTLFRLDIFSRPETDPSAYQKRKRDQEKIKRVQKEFAF